MSESGPGIKCRALASASETIVAVRIRHVKKLQTLN